MEDVYGMDREELSEDEDFLELIHHHIHPRCAKVYRNRPNYFVDFNDREFKVRFRLEKEVVQFIIEQISDEISSNTDR